jgi:hypothetical protein
MSSFVQTLEERRLFSITSATLAADLSSINTDAKAVKASVTALTKTAAADVKLLTADLKGSAKTNAALLKTLKTDEGKAIAKLKTDANNLTKATMLAKKSASAGDAVIKKPTSTTLTGKLSADITALGTVTTAPLAALQTDSNGTSALATDVTAITTANSSNTKLITDSGTTATDFQNGIQTLDTAGATFSAAVAALKADLTTLA